jgi:hypothetical protein
MLQITEKQLTQKTSKAQSCQEEVSYLYLYVNNKHNSMDECW